MFWVQSHLLIKGLSKFLGTFCFFKSRNNWEHGNNYLVNNLCGRQKRRAKLARLASLANFFAPYFLNRVFSPYWSYCGAMWRQKYAKFQGEHLKAHLCQFLRAWLCGKNCNFIAHVYFCRLDKQLNTVLTIERAWYKLIQMYGELWMKLPFDKIGKKAEKLTCCDDWNK